MSNYLHAIMLCAFALPVLLLAVWVLVKLWRWACADLKAEEDARTDAMMRRGMEVAALMDHPSWKWHRREPPGPRPKPTQPRPRNAA